MRVLVTGAGGFVGSAVVARAIAESWEVRPATRATADLSRDTDWTTLLRDVDVVVHTAARVHVMRDEAADPLTEFRRVNVEGTRKLAEQAVHAGVKRFIYLSSIKVNGEVTKPGRPFTPHDTPSPVDPYGVSKAEAEAIVNNITQGTATAFTIIRPVLVYGPGVKGNFLSMMRMLRKQIPLPFGAVSNARSLVSLDNLVDLIVAAARETRPANHTLLVSDGDDLSTTTLLRKTAHALNSQARLLAVPEPFLKYALRMVGKGAVAQRLLESLQVDISDANHALGWRPRFSVDEGLQKTARHFLQHDGRGV